MGRAQADDFGPRGDIREVRFAAQRLLAHSARNTRGELSPAAITDVVVVRDAALLSWQIGEQHGVMGLIRQYNRWWDALDVLERVDTVCWMWERSYPLEPKHHDSWESPPNARRLTMEGMSPELSRAASEHNISVEDGDKLIADYAKTNPGSPFGCITDYHHLPYSVHIGGSGGIAAPPRPETSGFGLALTLSKNDASAGFSPTLYARAPTQAEIIPYPTTYHFVSNAVVYFDLAIDSAKPVTFAPGTTIDIWFPFVLDDTLQYDLTIGFADRPIGPIYAKPFDNVLHYTLPGFTISPGHELMAEIDGNRPSL